MRDIFHIGMYTNKSRKIENKLTVAALLLIERTIKVSVRKLESINHESMPINSTLTIPLSIT